MTAHLSGVLDEDRYGGKMSETTHSDEVIANLIDSLDSDLHARLTP